MQCDGSVNQPFVEKLVPAAGPGPDVLPHFVGLEKLVGVEVLDAA
jgi:hypothetical protein